MQKLSSYRRSPTHLLLAINQNTLSLQANGFWGRPLKTLSTQLCTN